MLKIKIKLEKKDLRAFVRYNLLHNYPIYFLIVTFGFFLFNLLGRNYPIIKKDSLISTASIIIISFILFILYYMVSSILSGTIKDKKFLEEKSYEFKDKELVIYINEAVYPINWKEFSKIRTNKKYFFLYVSNSQAIIIPKRLLNTDELKTLHQSLKKAQKNLQIIISKRKYLIPRFLPSTY